MCSVGEWVYANRQIGGRLAGQSEGRGHQGTFSSVWSGAGAKQCLVIGQRVLQACMPSLPLPQYPVIMVISVVCLVQFHCWLDYGADQESLLHHYSGHTTVSPSQSCGLTQNRLQVISEQRDIQYHHPGQKGCYSAQIFKCRPSSFVLIKPHKKWGLSMQSISISSLLSLSPPP